MRIFRISLKILISTFVVLLLILFITVAVLRKSAVPVYNGEKKIAGLDAEARVIRDERGVPHIYSSNEHDLYLLTGYVSAQERLWQMDLIRHATRGRLSEIFGKDYVQTDLFMRSLNIHEKSKRLVASADPEILSAIQAYAEGVNIWIDERGKRLPMEFRILHYKPEPWTLEDIYDIIGYMGWDLATGNLSEELRCYRLAKKLGADKARDIMPDWNIVDEVVFPGFELNESEISRSMSFIASMDKLEELGIVSFSGSNNWAVSGQRSNTGNAILSNDMHLGFGTPGIWIQMHQVVKGGLNVTGVMIPGEPFIIGGHNEQIAWGTTNLGVDDIDLYVERTDSSGNYLFNGQWLPLQSREEIIKVKGAVQDTFRIVSTHHGPIISEMKDIKDAPLAIRWSGFDDSDEMKAVYLLNRATCWDEFRHAISFFRSISQNFAYADIRGNIGMNTGGGIPLRKGGGVMPRSGVTDEYDWHGYVPFELLPSLFNPADGFVSSANQRTVNTDYPFFISGNFAMPYRIKRIRQMAAEKKILGIDDFKRMVTDNHSAYAEMLTPVILKAAEEADFTDSLTQEAVRVLKNWDYSMDVDRIAPTLFEFIHMAMAYNIFGDELGDLYGSRLGTKYDFYIYRCLTEGPDYWVDNINTEQKETFSDIIVKSISSAVDTLKKNYGDDLSEWKWGKIHHLRIVHPLGSKKLLNKLFALNSKQYEVGGSYHTVEVYGYDRSFNTVHGASERYIYNAADWDESYAVIPTGTSGNPGSPFYLSQTSTYINNGFYKDPFTEPAVASAKKYEIIYRPAE
ncbi:MAG TPA: penicillin acylase family protein [Bacteroidales bacterium]|nr:penicillin acylase family protein [Bacteroidales bacterium]HPT11467.1 penicillin acylase family protein [Bacteroidales bacterium]